MSEPLERTNFEDNVVNYIPTAGDVLGKGSVTKPQETTSPLDAAKDVVDTPTSLAAGTSFNISFIFVVIIGLAAYFLLRRKK